MQMQNVKLLFAAAIAVTLGLHAHAGEPIVCAVGDDLQSALATARTRVDGGETDVTIQLEPGIHSISAELVLDRAITIVGSQDPSATTIAQTTTAWSGSQRVLNISANGATVSGLTLTIPQFTLSANGFPAITGAIVNMTGESVVTNCVISGPGIEKPIGTQNKFTVGGVNMSKGLVIDSTIRDIALSSGGGVKLTGGTLSGCLVTNCRAGNLNNKYTGGVGAGVRLDAASAVVTNCLITGNVSTFYPGAGVYLANGTLVDSRIVGNSMFRTATAAQAESEGIGVFQATARSAIA